VLKDQQPSAIALVATTDSVGGLQGNITLFEKTARQSGPAALIER